MSVRASPASQGVTEGAVPAPLLDGAAAVAGALVLVVEIAGTRLLAPSFGSGIPVWSALITVTLLSLAAGAAFGGRLCDRRPSQGMLSTLWFLAALGLGILPPLARFLDRTLAGAGFFPGLAVSSVALFGLPLFLLSAVTPFCVKLRYPLERRLGAAVGRVSAWGTFGSCLGALAAGFLLVPYVPIPRIFAAASLAAAFGGVVFFVRARRARTAAAGGLAAWALFLVLLDPPVRSQWGTGVDAPEVVFARQSLQGEVVVLQGPDSRHLLLDGIHQGGVDRHTGETRTPYTASLEALGAALVPNPRRVLLVGLGAALLPEAFRRRGAELVVAEVNPAVAGAARRWFGYDPAPGELRLADGRRVWREAEGSFDLVVLDAFAGEEVPAHLLTEEAFRELEERLAPGGAVLLNLVGHWEGPFARGPAAVLRTLEAVFPKVEVFALDEGTNLNNLFLAATRGADLVEALERFPGASPHADRARALLGGRRTAALRSWERDWEVPRLTDAFHPLERLDRRARLEWRCQAREVLRALHGG